MANIELLLSGGLGNQMFQYAFARKIQIKNGNISKLIININLFNKDRFNREFSLNHLNLPECVEVVDKKRPFVRMAGGIGNHCADKVYNILSPFRIYVWRAGTYKNINFRIKKDAYLYGYFQSEKYFCEHRDIIKDEVRVKDKVEPKNLELLYKIRHSNSVCVHIRRGDYLSEKLITCDREYYQSAIELMKKKHKDTTFFLFSDEIDWVKENYKGPDFVYVDKNNRDYQELKLMYNCRHYIISNSSYSWWAQYLSYNTDKIVIAPRMWMPNDPMKDIYMDEWIIM